MTTLTVEDFDRARRDPAVFAELLMGRPLWAHQLEVVESRARYRVVCAGRRAGKTAVFGAAGLHRAFAVAGSKVVIVSATDRSSKRMFKDMANQAAASPALRTSVVDESTSRLVLSNGSELECVPASMGAVRSAEADLLIVDEAGFVPQDIWEAAEPLVIARPGSKVLICSTPWGDLDHFFRLLWRQGMERPDDKVRSWHWPSSVSPLVDEDFLDDIAERSSAEYFEREYLAQWGDAAGAYFAGEDLAAARDERPMLTPEEAGGTWAVGGVDWGQARDASTLVCITVDGEATRVRGDGRPVYRVAYVFERYRTPYHQVIDELVAAASGYRFAALVTETNGVGQMPSEELRRALLAASLRDAVVPLTTTAATKADGFGLLRMLLQQRRLLLPDHPALLKQLHALRSEQLPGGGVRIAVPDAVGHDDLAAGLYLAAVELMNHELPAHAEVVVEMEDLFPGWERESAIGPDI